MRTRLFALFLLVVFSAQAQQRFVKEVNTIAELKALNTSDINKSCSVKGYLVPNDGGGGVFTADPTSVAMADGGIIIAPTAGAGRWTRTVSGRDYHALWWGGVKTNTVLQQAIDWVSANGWGRVICDGGTWTLKCDDSTRILMKSGVTLKTSEDSQLVCAPNPANNWILIDFPLDSHDMQVGPATLIGWNLAAPGGDPNKSGLIFSLQDTINVTIGGVKASNWWTQYADVGSNNQNLQMFDQDWQLGGMSFGAYGDGIRDDRKNLQAYAKFCENYQREFFLRSTTNGYLIGGTSPEDVSGGIWFTNRVPVKIRGENTLIKQFYYNPTEGVLPHVSGTFIITSDNCSVSGFQFTTVGAYPPTETNQIVSGFFNSIIIHNATNTLVENCSFDIEAGKGIVTSGSWTRIRDCFFSRCGVSTGLGNYNDWLFYEATVPARGIGHSPVGVSVMNNTFFQGSPYKHCVLFSSADDIICTGNKFLEQNCKNPILVYSGDLGITDLLGTNVYRFSGTVSHNTITGTNFGANAAITLRLNTTTNFVPYTFTPSNMYSAMIISENHINGTGLGIYNGIQLIKGNGTQILNNEVTVTGSPMQYFGNCNDTITRGNKFVSTLGYGVTIPMGEAFEAPPSFSDMIFENNEVTSPESDEYCIRNIEPIVVRNFTIKGNKFTFRGAAGSGDAPKVIQESAQQGFISVTDNIFYITNSMSGRRVATFGGTNNSTVNFSRNQSIVLPGSTVTRRGVAAYATDFADVNYNDVGSCEFNGVLKLNFVGNTVTSGDAYPYCLETFTVGNSMIQNNFLSNYFAGSTFAAVIRSTNSTFDGNLVTGNSASVLVVNQEGKMYVGNNNVINTGIGSNRIVSSPPGTNSHIVYEQPLNVDVGDIVGSGGYPFSIRRNGSPTTIRLIPDGWFTGSTRDAIWRTSPDNTNDNGGHAFLAHLTNGVDQFGFGVHGTSPPIFYIGDPTNSIFTFIGGLGTNTLLYLDNNRILQRVTLGANMTFSAGTLNSIAGGGGGTTNDTPWNLDHDANQFSLTNASSVLLRHNDASLTFLRASNTAGSSLIGTLAGGMVLDTSDNTSAFNFKFNASPTYTLNVGGWQPEVSSSTLGTSTKPWQTAYLSPIGTFIGSALIRAGTGTPEAIVTAVPGSIFIRTNGVAGTLLYVKETGTGNTGWVAYKSSATGTIPTTIMLACSDLTTTITAGTLKAYFRMPYAMTLNSVKASLVAAQTTGSIFTVDINETGTTVLSTKLTIDNNEKTSATAATAAVISDTSLAADAEITVDVDQAGTGPAGLIITLEGLR